MAHDSNSAGEPRQMAAAGQANKSPMDTVATSGGSGASGGGGVVWVTGLPGSGKSTLADALVVGLKQTPLSGWGPAVFLDGDQMRAALSDVAGGYDLASRQALAQTYAKLAAMLAGQGLTVVVATVSGFESVRVWLKNNTDRCVVVHVATDPAVCQKQQKDGLYDQRAAGGIQDLVGVDVAYEAPLSPTLVLGRPTLESVDERVQLVRAAMQARPVAACEE